MIDMRSVDELGKCSSELKYEGRFKEALELRLEAQRLLDAMRAPAKKRAMNFNYIAMLAKHAGNLELAEGAARDCIEIYQAENSAHSQLPPYPPGDNPGEQLATYCGMLASVLAQRGKFEEAEAWAVRSLEYFLSSGFHQGEDAFILGRKAFLLRIRNRDTQSYALF